MDLTNLPRLWTSLKQTPPDLQKGSALAASLNDDFQLFFVRLVLDHFEALLTDANAPPLRLLLLGTAGTGKAFAVQHLLHRLHARLREEHLPQSTVLVGAPTGSAAFNMQWGATTVHRLIHWFRPPHFAPLKPGSEALEKLQSSFQSTRLLLLDEISMIGRQMMGRIHSRLLQARPSQLHTAAPLASLSCVAVGDPAQCEAIFDQQLYDPLPRSPTAEVGGLSANAKLSNLGLHVYSTFQNVVILKTPQRVRKRLGADLSDADLDFNQRADRYQDLLHRFRDLRWTIEDYYWLCKRKRSAVSLGERLRFRDAPVLMDFRRASTTNPEQNCEFYNRMKLRALAQEKGTSVARFAALHTGIRQIDGLALDSSSFKGLPAELELAEGASVIITNNLAVEHGVMNGTHGHVT